ncbi:hypothetical protein SISSUDRAFT_1046662 [Sistotremastrum suecicum HHB10207 ss-3]|uniref:Uncharacterized protein n=1 Tax=Sistotremastrum suecicum HHB10207 ss-3 TaxID=1314776 RepID=A0A166DLA3_9AGAM|nr:hypothetical protein SISSUDRAFT_1046662 [Sistotremastrum suecicum HHB10207 ss-3]
MDCRHVGGFTRPKDLRALCHFPGGPATDPSRKHSSHMDEAYTSHTVFLLESRYLVRRPIGITDEYKYYTGICQSKNFLAVVQQFNAELSPGEAKEAMDNAYWPWTNYTITSLRKTKWWTDPDDRESAMKELQGVSDNQSTTVLDQQRKIRIQAGSEPIVNVELAEEEDEVELDVDSAEAQVPQTSGAPYTPHAKNSVETLRLHRARYLATLDSEPFWRPLLSVTFPTRPLATSVVRLAKALPHGLAYYASIPSDERKSVLSFSSRVRNLRMNRFRDLIKEVVIRLAGYRGGFPGLRYSSADRGMTINGERLAEPLTVDERKVSVGLAEWYWRGAEERNIY